MRMLLALLLMLGVSCETVGTATSPTPPASPLPIIELRYRVFDQVGRPWYCDPDFYPIARANEADLARQRLPEMQQDQATYSAILAHNGLAAGVAFTDQELLTIYHDWKDLQRLDLQPVTPAGTYSFSELVRPATGKQSDKVDGRIDSGGAITVVSRAPGGFLNCPICLGSTTRIATPSGSRLVTDLRVGDVVWTLGANGERTAAPIVEAGSLQAPPGHEVLRVALADGRSVAASPGHPTADGRRIGALVVGDALDGSPIVSIDRLPYAGRTYDLLPAGPTGAYWADGILLGSTLRRD
jgi:hypothetical protein